MRLIPKLEEQWFSEIYHPGWQAYIDGVEAPHGRADYPEAIMNVPAESM